MGFLDIFKRSKAKENKNNESPNNEAKSTKKNNTKDRKQWISANGTDFSELVNKKIEELENAGYGVEAIEEIKDELISIIQEEGIKDEWFESRINRKIELKLSTIKFDKNDLERRLKDIKDKSTNGEEQSYLIFYETEQFNVNHGHPINFNVIIKEMVKHLKAVGATDQEIEEFEKEVTSDIEDSQNRPPRNVLSSIISKLSVQVSLTKQNNRINNQMKAKKQEDLERNLKYIKDQYPESVQEYYRVYTIERSKDDESIDFNNVISTIKEHMATAGFGNQEIDKFIKKASDRIKESDRPSVTLSIILNELAGELGVIERAKERLTMQIKNILDSKNISEADKQFSKLYEGVICENYLKQLLINRIDLLKTEFALEFGHDKKGELIDLSVKQLQLLGYGKDVLDKTESELNKMARKSDNKDFISEASNVVQPYVSRNTQNLEDYTDEYNMALIDLISDKFNMPGNEGTKKFIRMLLSYDDEKLKIAYSNIDKRCFITPDCSKEINQRYKNIIEEYRRSHTKPDESYIINLEVNSMLKQMESMIANMASVRNWRKINV